MSQTPETMLLFARLAPNPETMHEIMLTHVAFRLSPAQQFATRVTFRTASSSQHVYESELPTGRYDGLRMGLHRFGDCNRLVEFYIDGDRHGPRRIWRADGHLALHDIWDHGEPCDMHREWYKNGTLKRQTYYVDGTKHSRAMTWSKFGQLTEQYDMVSGHVHGVYRGWYDNGQMCARCEFMYGIYHGSRLVWYDNGQQKKQQTYVKGERVGDCMRWARDGTLTKHIVYTRTVVVSDDPEDVAISIWQYWIAKYVLWPVVCQVVN